MDDMGKHSDSMGANVYLLTTLGLSLVYLLIYPSKTTLTAHKTASRSAALRRTRFAKSDSVDTGFTTLLISSRSRRRVKSCFDSSNAALGKEFSKIDTYACLSSFAAFLKVLKASMCSETVVPTITIFWSTPLCSATGMEEPILEGHARRRHAELGQAALAVERVAWRRRCRKRCKRSRWSLMVSQSGQ